MESKTFNIATDDDDVLEGEEQPIYYHLIG